MANWATAIDDGDPEIAQVLSFTVTNDNNALFAAQPSLASNGTLSYTPAANANGSATVSVKLTDDATAGGAAMTTAAQSFQITVSPANDRPASPRARTRRSPKTPQAQTVANWATAIDDGDPEIAQRSASRSPTTTTPCSRRSRRWRPTARSATRRPPTPMGVRR